ncbi:MAG: hypothetical protein PHS02_00410 [Candidatus ainarchaeum sp.]|nr:hypothetical protein [Candidatus ainarchaeum sp.]
MSLKMGEIRGMKEDLLAAKLKELEMELLTGQRQSTKVKSIRLSIARIRAHLSQAKKSAPASVKPAKEIGKNLNTSKPL